MNKLPIYALRKISKGDRPDDGEKIFAPVVTSRIEFTIKSIDGDLPCTEGYVLDGTIDTNSQGDPVVVREMFDGVTSIEPIGDGHHTWYRTKAEALVAAAEIVLRQKDGLVEKSLELLSRAEKETDAVRLRDLYGRNQKCSH